MADLDVPEDALVLFTKPARPGRVKTRLTLPAPGDPAAVPVTPEQAARLHAAFRDDLCERLLGGAFHLELAWALEDDEPVPVLPDVAPPEVPLPGKRQEGADLGARLHHALQDLATRHVRVAAVGSDHPELPVETVEDAFRRLERGADIVLGPVEDGGYYLIALRREAVRRELFEGIAWSTETVFAATVERAERLGLRLEFLPEGGDVDRPDDLARLAARLAVEDLLCPRTRALIVEWGRMPNSAAVRGDIIGNAK